MKDKDSERRWKAPKIFTNYELFIIKIIIKMFKEL